MVYGVWQRVNFCLLFISVNRNFSEQKEEGPRKKSIERKTSMFSVSSIQEDIEREQQLRKLQQEEEERRLENERQKVLKRNRMLAEKRHQIKRKLQQRKTQQQQQQQQQQHQDGSKDARKGGKQLTADDSCNNCAYFVDFLSFISYTRFVLRNKFCSTGLTFLEKLSI